MISKLRYYSIIGMGRILSIRWTGNFIETPTGLRRDCLVIAVTENEQSKPESLYQYSLPMTIEEVRSYIEDNKQMLGTMIKNCVGIELDNKPDSPILFEKPIPVNN